MYSSRSKSWKQFYIKMPNVIILKEIYTYIMTVFVTFYAKNILYQNFIPNLYTKTNLFKDTFIRMFYIVPKIY